MQSIGKTLQEARAKKGLTQEKMAQEIGVSRNYISDIESGRYVPSLKTTVKIATFLNINLNFLKSLTEIPVNKKPHKAS